MEDDFQVCRNCKRSVASLHFMLHEAHCLRFLVLCPECEEPIPKSKMKEHVEAVHQQTKESQQHPAKCKFCELAVQLSNLDIHESQCGSQTELCPHCNQPVTLRVLAQHKDLCLSAKGRPKEGKRIVSPPGRKTHCDICKELIPENKYASHMDFPLDQAPSYRINRARLPAPLQFGKRRPQAENITKKQCSAPRTVTYLRNGRTVVLPSTPPFTDTGNRTSTVSKDARPKTKSRNSSTKRETKDRSDTVDLALKSGLQQRAALLKGDETVYDILRNCCQCRILLPLPILKEHQEKCLRLAHQKKLMKRASWILKSTSSH